MKYSVGDVVELDGETFVVVTTNAGQICLVEQEPEYQEYEPEVNDIVEFRGPIPGYEDEKPNNGSHRILEVSGEKVVVQPLKMFEDDETRPPFEIESFWITNVSRNRFKHLPPNTMISVTHFGVHTKRNQ